MRSTNSQYPLLLMKLNLRRFIGSAILVSMASIVGSTDARAQSVARLWNEALLDAIRIDFPAPTVHSRNLYHTSAAMYDAWAAFDPVAGGHIYEGKHAPNGLGVEAARNEAISYAAYRVLTHRYSLAVDPVASQELFDGVMTTLGYDPAITDTIGTSPANVGNRIAQFIIDGAVNDGSNEANAYADNTGYEPKNVPMVVDFPALVTPDAPALADPNAWQPLFLTSARTQNDLVGDDLQVYIGPHWGAVTSFAMGKEVSDGQESWTVHDPGPPPMFGGEGDAQYRTDTVDLIRYSHTLDPNQGPGAERINISPRVTGNRPLGTHDDQGYAVNPVTGEAYADNVVKAADYGRVLAEFWADGPESETPPGHWNVLANEVSDDPRLVKRIGGTGVELDALQWDVKLYLTLNGALHDAAIGAWGSKREYDYVRPITKIRYQGGLGQSSDPDGIAYHPDGLPLEDGLIEQISAQSIAPGGRHRNAFDNANTDSSGAFVQNFTEEEMIGKVVINAWNHEPENPETDVSGSDWILAENWVPYQEDNFVTPAFAAYVSGHSTFSRAAAKVLDEFTGSEFFPGGLGEQTFSVDFLDFEDGPSEPVTLQWATYYDAADEAGISRLWGGIHIPADDFAGRIMGDKIGAEAFEFALGEFDWSELGWCNPLAATDVDNDGAIGAADAIAVRDELMNNVFSDSSGRLHSFSGVPVAFVDTNDDGFVSPMDILNVLNDLQAQQVNSTLSATAVPVPEPTSIIWLLGLWLGALRHIAACRWR